VPRATQADLLIVAAHPLELVGLDSALGRSLAGRLHGVRVVCRAVGVGVPAAAVGTMVALTDTRARALVLLGSCGVYARGRGARVQRVAVPRGFALVDSAELAHKAAFPPVMPARASTDSALRAALLRTAGRDALRGRAATTLGITTDDTPAAKIARDSGCVVENLEAVAVALAAAARRVPFAAVLVVTNEVGRRGRAQWAAQHAPAAERGARVVLDWIAAGAGGLPARR
jgi:futalosine hydrolase